MENMSKNKVAIGIGIVLTLGILAWIGWKYWGWFGGTGLDGFPANPKDGDNYTKNGKVYIYQANNCITTPCEGGEWIIFNPGDLPNQRQSFAAGGTIGVGINCHETKVINGTTYKLNGVWRDKKWNGEWNYIATYIYLGKSAEYIKITEAQYNNYVDNCFPLYPPLPDNIKHDCNSTFNNGVEYKFSSVEAKEVISPDGLTHYGTNYNALYTYTGNPPVTHPRTVYPNPVKLNITKQDYDRLRKCQNKQTA